MIAVIHFGSTKSPLIFELINAYSSAEWIDFQESDGFNPLKYKGIVLSGAPILITKDDIAAQLLFVQNCIESGVPLLGICFGHQLIGLNSGAEGFLQEEDRSLTEVKFLANNCPLVLNMNQRELFSEDHCEAITLPEDFKLFATSDKCENEGMMHQSKPWFGVQFHPETSGIVGQVMFKNFVNYCNSYK